jgi:hypothetical protein
MMQKKEPKPGKAPKEWPATSRQSKALKEIDKAIQSDEPAGEKLKKIVEDQRKASGEIARELAAHRESLPPPLRIGVAQQEPATTEVAREQRSHQDDDRIHDRNQPGRRR